jgi:hypothetical protein
VSFERDGDEWRLGAYYFTHPKIGSIRASGVHSVCVHLDGNQPGRIWEPNFIGRRIILRCPQAWMGSASTTTCKEFCRHNQRRARSAPAPARRAVEQAA